MEDLGGSATTWNGYGLHFGEDTHTYSTICVTGKAKSTGYLSGDVLLFPSKRKDVFLQLYNSRTETSSFTIICQLIEFL